MEKQNLTIDARLYDELTAYAEMLKIPAEVLVQRAIEAFLAEMAKQLGKESESAQTQLSYDEFWDGVEL